MNTRGELITAIKYPLPQTAEKCHYFTFFPRKPKNTILLSIKPVITFFADFPQKILFLFICSPKDTQQNCKCTRTCSIEYVTSYGPLSTKSTFCNKFCVFSPNHKSTSGNRIETKIPLKILHEAPNKSLLRFMTWAGIWENAMGRQK